MKENIGEAIDWPAWELLIQKQGMVIDRPRNSRHPRYPEKVYPLDYGYVPETVGGDGAEVDVFVGTAATGLSAVLVTSDALKEDHELKLLWNLTPEEVEEIYRFLNDGSFTATVVWRDHL